MWMNVGKKLDVVLMAVSTVVFSIEVKMAFNKTLFFFADHHVLNL